jgi:hypothetical protein
VEGNFMGLGLKNLIGIFIFVVVGIVVMKVVFTKYPVKGISDIAHAV